MRKDPVFAALVKEIREMLQRAATDANTTPREAMQVVRALRVLTEVLRSRVRMEWMRMSKEGGRSPSPKPARKMQPKLEN